MNKFNVLIASFMVFAVVAQLALAVKDTEGGLVNEIGEDEEIDDEVEGIARHEVGKKVNELIGYSVLDEGKGMPELVGKRTGECTKAGSREACEVCCNGLNKSGDYKGVLGTLVNKGKLQLTGQCTCRDRDTHYEIGLH